MNHNNIDTLFSKPHNPTEPIKHFKKCDYPTIPKALFQVTLTEAFVTRVLECECVFGLSLIEWLSIRITGSKANSSPLHILQ